MLTDQLNEWIQLVRFVTKDLKKEDLELDEEFSNFLIEDNIGYSEDFYTGVLAGIRAMRLLLEIGNVEIDDNLKAVSIKVIKNILDKRDKAAKKNYDKGYNHY